MNPAKKSILFSLSLLLAVLPLAACGSQTTLNRIGSVLQTASGAYRIELDALKAQGAFDKDPAHYDALVIKADAIAKQADNFARLISGLGTIAPNDVPRIIQAINQFVGATQAALTDPAYTGVNANSGAVAALRWIRASLDAAALVVAGLFPSPTPAAGATSAAHAVALAKPKKASEVKIVLPAVPKELQKYAK
jgi:hypothetical protein